MGEDYFLNGFKAYMKAGDGEYVPVKGIPEIKIDTPELENVTTLREAAEGVISFRIRKGSLRKIRKQVLRGVNHMKRIHRHERRLKERMRRARLKGQPWICLRDKDGGQICMSTSKRVGEHGWMTIRNKRKIVWPEKGEAYGTTDQ